MVDHDRLAEHVFNIGVAAECPRNPFADQFDPSLFRPIGNTYRVAQGFDQPRMHGLQGAHYGMTSPLEHHPNLAPILHGAL